MPRGAESCTICASLARKTSQNVQSLSFYWPFIRLGATDVWRHKTRSFLTMLGMVFGVGSVIAMLAVGEGASHQALESIKRLGSQNIMISSVKPTSEENSTVQQS